ncbi:ATP-binding cassette domain-containing protein [Prochlorococcus marinus]|uniref:ATP-binding cassette domain-containing protein n=1 Tax=Prochlorococcus marinus TaxID=1219 RepID=UPI001ADA5FC9|nr:ATP-binding cassette domain-containing protein [Prochlorococcus marinus]MBO8204279.1 ATP-binding cassette domain-containing protein [Prochlorococcus marinus CUG1415]MBW3043580.1 phosphonate ABC transporter [Prochlorococcus marinus str. MU1415]
MKNTLLELKNISYKYKNNLILNKVNLKINSGEKIALLGKSGSGKTSLISVLNGTIKPTKGEVKLFNKSFEELDRKQKRKIATIWQDLRLIEDLSAEQNVNCGLLAENNFYFAFKNLLNIISFKKAHKYMKLCNLDHSIYAKNIKKLSGGQKQRVAIARSLIQGSNILLADEPFNNLDPKLITVIKNLLLKNVDKNNIKSPKTTLVALHRLDLLNDFDKVIGIRDGKILFNIERTNLRKFHLDKLY